MLTFQSSLELARVAWSSQTCFCAGRIVDGNWDWTFHSSIVRLSTCRSCPSDRALHNGYNLFMSLSLMRQSSTWTYTKEKRQHHRAMHCNTTGSTHCLGPKSGQIADKTHCRTLNDRLRILSLKTNKETNRNKNEVGWGNSQANYVTTVFETTDDSPWL